MSSNVLDQIVCAICACLQYRLESIEINIAKVPNQHLLYSIAELPSCVLRVNLDINSNSGNIDISGKLWIFYISALFNFNFYIILKKNKLNSI
jgi:hypothetical protein